MVDLRWWDKSLAYVEFWGHGTWMRPAAGIGFNFVILDF